MIKTVFFDLDGTLLPMDMEVFIKAYFKAVAAKLVPRGFDVDQLTKVIWKGTKYMVSNTGEISNEEMFWKTFFECYPDRTDEEKIVFNDFYINNFDDVKNSCGFNPESGKTIKVLKDMGYNLVLASNPLFPRLAQQKRMRWAGVDPDDFSYITSYENSRFCKPNPDYYKEILGKLGLVPEECLMVGNDTTEDMIAETLGLKVYLVTDWMINPANKDISVYPHGHIEGLLEFIRNI